MPTKKKPIYVPNPNDPRIRAYSDSLALYNKGETDYTNKKRELIKNIDAYNKSQSVLTGMSNLFSGESYKSKYKEKTVPMLLREKYSSNINWPFQKTYMGDDSRSSFRIEGVYDPLKNGEKSNLDLFDVLSRYKKPEQPYIYKKVEEEKKKEKKPIITTDRRKVQAYNDSSFIKKNFNIFPKPKGYDQTLKRVGQDPSADYFPAPEQPYILKKEKKKIKKDIVSVPVKESIPKDTIPVVKPIIEPVVKPQVEKEPEPIVPKKLPGGSGPFARYPNMRKGFFNRMKDNFSGLMQNRKVNSRNVNNITVTGPKYQNGTKKLSYKDWKNSLPDNLRAESKLYNLRGAYEGGLEPELNEDGFYHLGSRNPKTGEILKSPAHNTFKEAINADRKLGYIPLVKPDGKVYTQNPEEQTFISGAKSVKQYRGDENLPEAKNGMKKCGCKHVRSKYKYGTGAVVIPEDSAIVTANGGKGKKAVEAYLNGDHERVEDYIKKMPTDNPTGKKYKYKNDAGNKKLKSSSALGYVPAGQRKDKYYGKVADADFDKLRENNPWYDWANFDPSRKGDVEKFQAAFNKLSESLGSKAKLEVDDKLGEQTATAKVDYMGNVPEEKVIEKKEELEKKKDDTFATSKRGGDFLRSIPSLAEVAAKASILKDGPEKTAQNYLNLNTPEYASQLPKILNENTMDANSAKQIARNVSGGNVGNYLANASDIYGSKLKANNLAVIDDTIARQAVINEGIGIKNDQAKINTGLKNQFSQQDAANRGAYNNMLVSLGQSVDTAVDASKLMSNQRGADNQRLAILKSMADSGNYDITTNPDGTMSYSVKKAAKGIKRLKTYKRK